MPPGKPDCKIHKPILMGTSKSKVIEIEVKPQRELDCALKFENTTEFMRCRSNPVVNFEKLSFMKNIM